MFLEKINNKYLNKAIALLGGFEKYTALAALGVASIYVINYVGVEYFSLVPRTTYLIATGFNYILSFVGNSKIFGQKLGRKNLPRFLIAGVIFYLSINLLFNFLVSVLRINYIIAITVNVAVFPVIKFLSYKYLVFTGYSK